MKHTTEDLRSIAYSYYPRGIPFEDPRYRESEEHARLVTARREAGARREVWRAMLDRLRQQYDERCVHDDVLSCPPEWLRAGYEGSIVLPEAPGEHSHSVAFVISFLVPYYLVYSSRIVDDPEQTAAVREARREKITLVIDGVMWALPRDIVKPEIAAQVDREFDARPPARRRDVSFTFSQEEQTCAASVVREIEATYGYEHMPPEIGNVVVPDVETGFRRFGEVRLYDCLFSDSGRDP